MTRNLNRATFVGRLGDFPEMRYTPSGLEIAKINLAVSNDRYDKETEEYENRTDWISITLFGWKANKITEKASKGSTIYIECRVSNNNYESKSGDKVYSYNFVGDYFEILNVGQYGEEEPDRNEGEGEDQVSPSSSDDGDDDEPW